MKKLLSLFAAALMAVSMFADKTLYLVPNSNWQQSSARFAAYYYGNGDGWASMTLVESEATPTYEVAIPDGYASVIFCRMNPGTADNKWDNKWNQTNDLTVPTNDNNCYTIADGAWDYGDGYWSVLGGEAPVLVPFTFENGSTWYFDFTAVSGGANWPTANGGSDYDGAAGGKVKSVTFTQDITKNLGEGWSSLKTNTGGWTNIALPEEAPAEEVNCIAIAADGKTASWSTYSPDPADIKTPFTFANGSTWYFDFTAVEGGANWPTATGGSDYNANAGGNVLSTTFTQDITKNLGEAWGSLKTNTGNWTSIELPADEPENGVNCIVIAADGLTASWSTYEPAPAVQITIYFINKDNWSQVNAHLYGGNASGTTWPGMLLTNTGEQVGEYDIYSLTYNEGDYTTIIFNNNGSNQIGSGEAINTTNVYFYDGVWYESLEAVEAAFPQPTLETEFFIAGTFNGWSTSSHNFVRQNLGDEVAYCTIANVTSAADIEFKIVNKASGEVWMNAKVATLDKDNNTVDFYDNDENGYQLAMTPYAAGDYTCAFNLTTKTLTVTYPEGDPMGITYDVYLTGAFNEWSASADQMTEASEGVFTITQSFVAGDHEIKVIENTSWRGANYNITREACTDVELNSTESGVNAVLKADKAGDYTFTYNVADHTLSVAFPELENRTAYFLNTPGYETVYAHVYNANGGLVDWPGELATATGEQQYGYDVYKYEFLETYTGVIFHGNTGTQVELAFDPAKPYITEAGAVAELNDINVVDATISEYQYSTLYSDKALRIPAGVTVEYVSAVVDNALVRETLTDIIPANTGVMISGPVNATFTFVEGKTIAPIEGNLLKGTLSTETVADNGLVHYILSLNESNVFGLYWPYGTTNGVGEFTNQGGKAYLELPSGPAGAPRGFALRHTDVVTSLQGVDTDALVSTKVIRNGQLYIIRNSEVYTLQGVRVQ